MLIIFFIKFYSYLIKLYVLKIVFLYKKLIINIKKYKKNDLKIRYIFI